MFTFVTRIFYTLLALPVFCPACFSYETLLSAHCCSGAVAKRFPCALPLPPKCLWPSITVFSVTSRPLVLITRNLSLKPYLPCGFWSLVHFYYFFFEFLVRNFIMLSSRGQFFPYACQQFQSHACNWFDYFLFNWISPLLTWIYPDSWYCPLLHAFLFIEYCCGLQI